MKTKSKTEERGGKAQGKVEIPVDNGASDAGESEHRGQNAGKERKEGREDENQSDSALNG